jgi:hypothetical protein
VQPGFVDTAMMKTDRPLPALAKRLLWRPLKPPPDRSCERFENERRMRASHDATRWSRS